VVDYGQLWAHLGWVGCILVVWNLPGWARYMGVECGESFTAHQNFFRHHYKLKVYYEDFS